MRDKSNTKEIRLIIRQLNDFIEDRELSNTWINGKILHIYVRKGKHLVFGKLIDTLDIATIESRQPGKGYFTAFLHIAESLSKKPIFIENVMEERLQNFFIKQGYTHAKLKIITEADSNMKSFIKEVKS